jgi:hypothetical protein
MPYILDKPVDSGTPSSDYSLDAPRVFESFSKADPFLLKFHRFFRLPVY